MSRARHVDRMPLAVGVIRNGETTLVDLRDEDGPVAEIMRAVTEVELAYVEFHTLEGREAITDAMHRWLDARRNLRQIASRVVYGPKDGTPAAKRDAPVLTGISAPKVADTGGEGNEGGQG